MPKVATRCPSRSRYQAMIRAEAINMGIDPEKALSRSRIRPYVLCRFRVFARLRAEGHYSLPGIGRVAGMDHTTVLHALRQIEKLEARYAADVALEAARKAKRDGEAKLPPKPAPIRKPRITTPVFVPVAELSKWRAA